MAFPGSYGYYPGQVPMQLGGQPPDQGQQGQVPHGQVHTQLNPQAHNASGNLGAIAHFYQTTPPLSAYHQQHAPPSSHSQPPSVQHQQQHSYGYPQYLPPQILGHQQLHQHGTQHHQPQLPTITTHYAPNAPPPSGLPSYYQPQHPGQPALLGSQQSQHWPAWSQPLYGTPVQSTAPVRDQAYVHVHTPAKSPSQHVQSFPSEGPPRTSQHRVHSPHPTQQNAPQRRPSHSSHLPSGSIETHSPRSPVDPLLDMPGQRSQRTPRRASRTSGARLSSSSQNSNPNGPNPSLRPTPAQESRARVKIPNKRSFDDAAAHHHTSRPIVRAPSEGEDIIVRHVPSQFATSSSQNQPSPSPAHIDYQTTLLSLADEYLQSAHSIGARVATPAAAEEEVAQYQNLIAAAMRCLESVLKNTRISDPRKEARVRLQLATLILDETESMEAAEDVLSKGIVMCERNKLQNMKYAMQHLLARICFRSREQIAFRMLDRVIEEVTALRLHHWTYAFHFLRVSLAFQHKSESTNILRHLNAIATIARMEQHVSVGIVAAALAALVHLRTGLQDSVQSAQRSLAEARTHQLSAEMKNMPQVQILLDILDLACCMVNCKFDELEDRLSNLQDKLTHPNSENEWSGDAALLVPLSIHATDDIDVDTAAIMQKTTDNELALTFTWLSQSQLHIFSYLLTAMVKRCRNATDGKADKFFKESLALVQGLQEPHSQSRAEAASILDWQQSMDILINCQLAFACCGRADWPKAREVLDELTARLDSQTLVSDDTEDDLRIYITAMVRQGLGELESAHRLYKDSTKAFDPSTKFITAKKDIQALASLNSILLLRSLSPHEQTHAEALLSTVETYCSNHRNPALKAAYFLVKATMSNQEGVLRLKSYLQSAMQDAKTCKDGRLLCVCMNLMGSMFFHNIVGTQAEKSAKASSDLAHNSKDKLWIAVANGNFAETLELSGKRQHFRHIQNNLEAALHDVPEEVKRRIGAMRDRST